MNQGQLIERIATRCKISREFATDTIHVVLDEIALALCRDEEVVLVRFGRFRNRRFTERTTRNPQTGQPVHLPARLNPEFRSAPDLKRRVNEAQGITGIDHKWSRG